MQIKDLSQHVDNEVTLKGWLNNKRSSGKIAFLEIRDGSGYVQAVASTSDVSTEVWEEIEKATQESSLEVVGKVVKHPKQEGVYELQVSSFKLFSLAEEYPISKKDHGPEFLSDNRHLWLRSKRQWAILRVRDVIISAVNEYFHKESFVKFDSPILTPNACEGTTTLFGVPYFDQGEAFLSQSGQLYLEAGIMSLGKCYDFGPVFRAEKSTTKRHLTEFWMMDAEAAFMEHDENVKTQEGLVKYVVSKCLEECGEEFKTLERDLEPLKKVIEKPFTRLTYKETIEKLNELGSDIKFGEDLGNDDEGILTKDSDVPIFIEKWPKNIKPFYMKIDPTDETRVLNNDLIGIEGAGELIGGSQREDDYEILLSRIKEDGLDEKEYEWYTDLRKYGSVPHSGFGLGIERMVMWLSGAEHIRECIPFPRRVNRLKP